MKRKKPLSIFLEAQSENKVGLNKSKILIVNARSLTSFQEEMNDV